MKDKARGWCNGTANSVSGLFSISVKHFGASLGVGCGHFNFWGFPLPSSTFSTCKIKDLIYISGFQMFFSCRYFFVS